MTFYNKVILTGKVATLPQHHYRPDGSPVIQFALELDVVDSTLREGKNLPGREQPQGNRRSALNRTGSGSLIDVVAFGEWAESKLDLLKSSQHLLVVGRLNQRHWQTPEGKKRTRMEVIATDLRRVEETNHPSALPRLPVGRQGRQATANGVNRERRKE
jgi:single-strand DNA-binding protein